MNPFLLNRKRLAAKISDGLILLAGGSPVLRNGDVPYPFRQRSDFLYLTGVEEPDCLALIDPRRSSHTLFLPRIDDQHRAWLGHVPGPAEARRSYSFSRALHSDQLAREMRKARRGHRVLHTDLFTLRKLSREKGRPTAGLSTRSGILRDALDELRAVKSPGEIRLLKRAAKVTCAAFRSAMARVRPGMFEYEVQALFESACLGKGLRHLGFASIVAAGRNSAVLHYPRHDTKIRAGDLLLMDAGAEHLGYAADVTRTFPADGRFTRRQRDVYSIVLETQKAMIAAARPGVVSVELHLRSMTMIAEGLKSLGLLRGDTAGLVESGAVRLFYPHGLSHMLGLDVHDSAGGRKRKLPNPAKIPVRFVARLEPGFVLTMEPGVYFIEALLRNPELRRKHRGSVDFRKAEKFLDFGGIRIEDDIVIRRSGPPLNLTDVPKEIGEVERLIRG